MDRNQMLWKLTAEQFAAFDVQLYLDTHPNDMTAMQMFNNYQKNANHYKAEFESMHGPLMAESATNDAWKWIKNPWPWEREAN